MNTLILALAQNQVYEKNGELPWNSPEDLAHFKEKTSSKNSILFMTKATKYSLKKIGKYPLPNRICTACTKTPTSIDEKSISDILSYVKNYKSNNFVIGGKFIWKSFLNENIVDTIYISQIDVFVEGGSIFDIRPYLKNYRLISQKRLTVKSGNPNVWVSKYEKINNV
jgi:dihydrofolate reductase